MTAPSTFEPTIRANTPRYRVEKSSVVPGRWHVYDYHLGAVARNGTLAYFDVRNEARDFAAVQESENPWPAEAIRADVERRFWANLDRSNDGCWEWLGYREPVYGYGRFHFGDDQLAHRVAWTLAKGPIPDGLDVLHHCDNPPCCNYERCLFLGTQADNNADRNAKGRTVLPCLAGERHGMAKLTEADVRAIRALAASGTSQAAIAIAYDVSQSAVSCVVLRKRWGHVA